MNNVNMFNGIMSAIYGEFRTYGTILFDRTDETHNKRVITIEMNNLIFKFRLRDGSVYSIRDYTKY